MTYSRKIAAALAASVCVVAIATPAQAQVRQFNISGGNLKSALDAYARQSGRQVIYKVDEVRSARSKGVHGSMSSDDALDAVLGGSGFAARKDASGAVAIVRAPAAVASGEAQAGSAPAEDESASDNERGKAEILVVGSRSQNVDIKRAENDPQPYVVFNSKDISRSGASNVGDFLKQNLTANTVSISNDQRPPGALGNTSSINLRGLGANETLILVDGRRRSGINLRGNFGQPDLNGLPISAIERIEVLPTSASAIYGGVALGGVVNIILKRNYKGGSFTAQYGNVAQGDSQKWTAGANYGWSMFGGKTEIMLGGQYSTSDPLLLRDRADLVHRGIDAILVNRPKTLFSTTTLFRGSTPNIASQATFGQVPVGTPGATCIGTLCFASVSPNLTIKAAFGGGSLGSPITSVPAGAAPNQNIIAALKANAGAYNLGLPDTIGLYGLQSQYGVSSNTNSEYFTIRQKMFESSELFIDFSRYENRGTSFTNPFDGQYPVSASSPMNPFNEAINISFPYTGKAPYTSNSTTNALSVGYIQPLFANWKAEIDYTRSHTSYQFSLYNPDTTPLIADIRSGVVNPFVDTVAFPLNLDKYLSPLTYMGSLSVDDVGVRMSGLLPSLINGRPTLTLGMGYRREASGNAYSLQAYPTHSADNIAQTFLPQSQSTMSLYGETLIPIVNPENGIPLVDSLELQLAGRWEAYGVNTQTTSLYTSPAASVSTNPQILRSTSRYSAFSPTIAVKYHPFSGLMLRGSFGRAFLPPTFQQLLVDPTIRCASSLPCRTIVDPANSTSYLVNYTTGGNPLLRPQTSKSWNFGAVFAPRSGALKGFRVGAEYYTITQPDYISLPTIQQLVSNPAFADHVHRDPTTQAITSVDVTPVNATQYETSGADLNFRFERDTQIGTFGIAGTSTWIFHDRRQFSVDGPTFEFAGFPNDGGEAKWKANAELAWNHNGITVSWAARVFGSYTQTEAPNSPTILQGGSLVLRGTNIAQGSDNIPSQVYNDLFISYKFGAGEPRHDILSGMELSLQVSNIFDKSPPFDAFLEPYYYSPYGDIRMRELRLTLRKDF